MLDWRSIFSWKTVIRDIKIGDRVKIIASEILIMNIDIPLSSVRPGYFGVVEGIDEDAYYGDPNGESDSNTEGYHGFVRVTTFYDNENWVYPYSHWRDFLEIIDD
jgi:hypothetical protein